MLHHNNKMKQYNVYIYAYKTHIIQKKNSLRNIVKVHSDRNLRANNSILFCYAYLHVCIHLPFIRLFASSFFFILIKLKGTRQSNAYQNIFPISEIYCSRWYKHVCGFILLICLYSMHTNESSFRNHTENKNREK